MCPNSEMDEPILETQGRKGLTSFYFTGTDQETFDVLLEGVEIGFGQIETIQVINNTDRETVCDLPPPSRHCAFSTASSVSLKSVSYYNEEADLYDYPPSRRENIVSTCSLSSSVSSASSSVVSSDAETSPKVLKDTVQTGKQTCSKFRTSSNSSKLEQIRALLEDETDPVNVLCGCLNIPNDPRALDEKMTSMIVPTETLKNVSCPPVSYGHIGKLLCPFI